MKFKRFVKAICSNDFSCFIAKRLKSLLRGPFVLDTMLASEDVIRRDWDSPEEYAAWEHL
jgi:hypothetical protein